MPSLNLKRSLPSFNLIVFTGTYGNVFTNPALTNPALAYEWQHAGCLCPSSSVQADTLWHVCGRSQVQVIAMIMILWSLAITNVPVLLSVFVCVCVVSQRKDGRIHKADPCQGL